jgi:hypothetical protein
MYNKILDTIKENPNQQYFVIIFTILFKEKFNCNPNCDEDNCYNNSKPE